MPEMLAWGLSGGEAAQQDRSAGVPLSDGKQAGSEAVWQWGPTTASAAPGGTQPAGRGKKLFLLR